jgi:ribonuclease-3
MSGAPERKKNSLLRRLASPFRDALGGPRAAHPEGNGASTLPASVSSPPLRSSSHSSLSDGERVHALQRDLEMRFADATVLREALTHRSYLNEINQAWPSNERLEFLGDAVLGLLTTDYLFRRFPELGEGELTNLRSALVRTETLARFAQEIDLGRYLFLGRGEEMSQGRRRPAGLACAFEALLGSIYIDAGYATARNFAMRFVEPELATVVEGRLHRNAKSVLQELVQAQMQQTPSYHLIEESGPDHAKAFTIEVRIGDEVLGRGHDRSKRGAEQSAAEIALRHLTQPKSQELEAQV